MLLKKLPLPNCPVRGILLATMTDKQFASISAQLHDQLLLMTKEFAKTNARIDNLADTMATKQQMSAVYDLFDRNLKEHEKQEMERLAMNRELRRHEHWIEQLASNTQTTLHYADD